MNRTEILKRFPNASESFIRKNCAEGIRPDDPQPVKGKPLVRSIPRKETGLLRAHIRFVIFSRRPADWDNYHVKELQDLLVHAGILGGDHWDILEGSVRSEKAYSQEEERTEIVIEKPERVEGPQ